MAKSLQNDQFKNKLVNGKTAVVNSNTVEELPKFLDQSSSGGELH